MTRTKAVDAVEAIPVAPGQVEAFDPSQVPSTFIDSIRRQYTGPEASRYRRAELRAKGKHLHVAPPGVLDLPVDGGGWITDNPKPGDCAESWNDQAAQLRTAYVRLAVGGSRATYSNGYKSAQGRASWVAVGIVCGKCGALWLRPVDTSPAK